MIYQLLLCFVALVLDRMATAGVATNETDLEIALLRRQLRILERKTNAKARLSRPEKLMLVVLVFKLKGKSQRFHDRLREGVLLIKLETVLKWHRELARRKWTFRPSKVGGRPRVEIELEVLIVRLARENPRMG